MSTYLYAPENVVTSVIYWRGMISATAKFSGYVAETKQKIRDRLRENVIDPVPTDWTLARQLKSLVWKDTPPAPRTIYPKDLPADELERRIEETIVARKDYGMPSLEQWYRHLDGYERYLAEQKEALALHLEIILEAARERGIDTYLLDAELRSQVSNGDGLLEKLEAMARDEVQQRIARVLAERRTAEASDESASNNGKPPCAANSTPVPDLVTLDQCASMVHKSKKTLEREIQADRMPPPYSQGTGGRASLWDWKVVKPFLEKQFNIPALPDRFPGNVGKL